jgi:hypothetical protein
MQAILLRCITLSILLMCLVLGSACAREAPASIDSGNTGSVNEQPAQVKTEPAEHTTNGPPEFPKEGILEQKSGQPAIDKLEVLLRSGLDEGQIITLVPNGETPQPKIEVKSLYTAEIKCIARSEKGEPLQYDWKATGGKIYGTGEKVTWMAPGAPMVYKITVTVIDSGGSASAPVNISVRCCY